PRSRRDSPAATSAELGLPAARPQTTGRAAGRVCATRPTRDGIAAASSAYQASCAAKGGDNRRRLQRLRSICRQAVAAKTTLLDFTAERNPDLQPDPPMPGNEVGGGTRIALAVQATAPSDEMLLVRIPADAPYQVEQLANVIHGRQWLTDALARRDAELRLDKKRIDDMRVELRVRRRLALETFSEDETARKAAEEYRQMQKTFNDMEKSYADKSGRLLSFLNQLPKLRGVSTVVLGMAWTDGFPNLPGQPPVLRYLEVTDLHDAAWIQVVPKRQGQV